MKLRITPVFPVKRFAAVSAQNVKNVQFDYTNMPTYNTDHQVARTATLSGGTCRIHEWPVCCGFLTKNRSHTRPIMIYARNTGGNQPCTLPPCALRYPKFIISLL